MRPIDMTTLARVVRATLYGTVVAAAVPVHAGDDLSEGGATFVGSRIPRATADATSPLVVLTREDLQRTGLTSLGDILQELTISGPALNTQFNGGGNGETQVSLRNPGANRTLVLVDGRRWISNLGGAVDVDSIPLAIVERVEILLEGASAIYGSAAIAGVVNVVTRRDIQGAEATAYLGENEQGDARTEQYDFAIGSATDRANVALIASYTKQEPVFAGDRGISSVPTFGFPGNDVNTGASSTTPFGRFGFGAAGNRLPNGAPGTLTLIPGRPGTSAADFRPFDLVNDGFNFSPAEYLLTPQERTGVFVSGRYRITDDIGFESAVSYNELRSEQRLSPSPFIFGTAASGANRFTIAANALYNPFGVPVTRAQYRNTIEPRSFNQDADTFRFSGGLDGAFDLTGRAFAWNVAYDFADNELRNSNTGQFDANRLALGLGPSFRDANGVARCGTPTAVVAGCVPIDIFGGPDAFTQQMADYARFVEQDNRYRKTYDYTANLTGELFQLPAGPLGFAAGYEYRRESGFDQPDALTTTGASNVIPRQPTRGAFSLDELYAEFTLPILQDVRFADALEVSVAARWSDYSNFGETTSPKVGFRWQPFADLQVRGGYSEDFRAPSISELFVGNSYNFPTVFDPCSPSQQPVGEVLSRCRNGIGGVLPRPDGYEQNQQIRTTIGGNPDLAPETASSRTLGLSWRASGLEGLDVHLDWYRIRVANAITVRSAQSILDDCYRNGTLSACAQITRQVSGDILDVFAGTQNISGGVETEGYDFHVGYGRETRFGALRLDWDTAYLSYYGDVGQPEAGDALPDGLPESRGNLSGTNSDRLNVYPRLKSNITTRWQRGDWSASASARYVAGTDEDCSLPVVFGRPELCSDPDFEDPQFGGAPTNHLDDTWYFDVQASWDSPWNARITAGIRNAFDEDPPVSFSTFDGNFDPSYELPGRFWYLRYQQSF